MNNQTQTQKEKSVQDLLYVFSRMDKFLEMEDVVRKARNEMLDLMEDFCNKHDVSIRKRNELLDKFTAELRRTLFLSERIKDNK